MKRISIGSWAYTIGPYEKEPVDFFTVCEKLKELGFDGVELGGFPPHPNPDDIPQSSARQQVAARVRQMGLEFSGLAANLWGEHLIDTDDPSGYISEFTKNCDFCTDMGIETIRVDTVQPPTIFETVDRETALARVVDTWKRCCSIAADHGLQMTWEFEPGFAFNKPSDVVQILDAIPDKNFGVMYDTCHGQMVAVVGARHPGAKEVLAGGQLELIQMLSGRINHIHLIDSDNSCHKAEDGTDETSSHPPFGLGVLDFDSIVPALAKETLPHDWWTIDLCFWPDAWQATASCKTSIDELNSRYGVKEEIR
ncbi:MAG TPA: sugar phosphate isomerase/epimerase [Planctomycetes bacterium]|nr:sugar phosphate isomerase/epimerase [Planctomycetota bacterium]HIK82201.1 sugar phosphate isomerase/epimerase [Planctomycetota bacterium]